MGRMIAGCEWNRLNSGGGTRGFPLNHPGIP